MKLFIVIFLASLALAYSVPLASFEEEDDVNLLELDDESRSLQELWEKVKNYFEDLGIEIKKKYSKFGDWVKNSFKDGFEKGETEDEKIKNIAKEFAENAENVSKETAEEAKDFLKPYKDDLGELWNKLKEKIEKIIDKSK